MVAALPPQLWVMVCGRAVVGCGCITCAVPAPALPCPFLCVSLHVLLLTRTRAARLGMLPNHVCRNTFSRASGVGHSSTYTVTLISSEVKQNSSRKPWLIRACFTCKVCRWVQTRGVAFTGKCVPEAESKGRDRGRVWPGRRLSLKDPSMLER